MTKNLSKLGIATAMLVSLSIGVHAEVIDFNGSATSGLPGGIVNGDLYTYFTSGVSHAYGYTFNTKPGYIHLYGSASYANVYGAGFSGYGSNNGTDFFMAQKAVTINRSDNRAFDLNGFDLDNAYDDWSNPPDASFIITGTKVDGAQVSTVVTLDKVFNKPGSEATAFNHFSLTGFTNLTSFEISRQNDGRNVTDFSLDNLDVSVSPVPEPSTWAMLTIGVAGLLWRRKRRASAA